MRTSVNRVIWNIPLAIALVFGSNSIDTGSVSSIFVGKVFAQSAHSSEETNKRNTPAIRNWVYKKLAKAQKFAEQKKYQKARVILDEMIAETSKKKALNSYELANVYNTYAYLRYANEDYKGSLNYYQLVIEQPDIPLTLEIETRYTIAQLYFVQEDWKNGIDALNVWLDMTDKPNSNAFVLLANAYYQLKEYDESLRNINIAMDMEKGAGQIPKEQWYNLARFLYYDKGDIDSALETLRSLILHYPKYQYYLQASHMLSELELNEEALSKLKEATALFL